MTNIILTLLFNALAIIILWQYIPQRHSTAQKIVHRLITYAVLTLVLMLCFAQLHFFFDLIDTILRNYK